VGKKEFIKEIKTLFGEESPQENKLMNLITLMASQRNIPSISPTVKAPEQIEPTMENIGESLSPEEKYKFIRKK
jgi:hypothetical protein